MTAAPRSPGDGGMWAAVSLVSHPEYARARVNFSGWRPEAVRSASTAFTLGSDSLFFRNIFTGLVME